MTAFFLLRHDCAVLFEKVLQFFHRNGTCFGAGCCGKSGKRTGSLAGSHAGRLHAQRGKCRSVSTDTATGGDQIAAVLWKQRTARHGRDDFRLMINLFASVGTGVV